MIRPKPFLVFLLLLVKEVRLFSLSKRKLFEDNDDKGLVLSCFVGLSNLTGRDDRKLNPSVKCPADKHYVCIKMFGGGMGDQVQRYCKKLSPEEYETVVDNEARVNEGEDFDEDPNCFQMEDKGREVFICRCSTKNCNLTPGIISSSFLSWILPAAVFVLLF